MDLKKPILILLSLYCLFGDAQIPDFNIKKMDSIGIAIDESINDLDESYFNSIFDVDEFFLRIFNKKEGDSLSVYETAFKKGFSNKFSYPKKVFPAFDTNGNYDYLKHYLDTENRHHLIFRLDSDLGINYHDFLLKKINNKYKIIDAYFYVSGENISKTTKYLYDNVYFERGLSKENRKYSNSLKTIKTIKELIAKGEFKKAHLLFQKIPSKISKGKVYQLININIVSNLSNKIYLKSIEDYEKLFPNDRSLFLVLMDASVIRKDFKKAFYYIDKLDNNLGKDEYLDLYRGGIYLHLEDYKNAKLKYEVFKTNFPDNEEGYYNLLFCYNELENYDLAIEIIENLIEEFYYDENEIMKFMKKEYPKTYRSKVFKEWLEIRKSIDRE